MPRFHALARQVKLLDVFMAAAGLSRDDRLKHTTKHVGKGWQAKETCVFFSCVVVVGTNDDEKGRLRAWRQKKKNGILQPDVDMTRCVTSSLPAVKNMIAKK